MAYFQYLSQLQDDCLLTGFRDLLEEAGLKIAEEFSNSSQIFAISYDQSNKLKSKAKVIISWKDKSEKQCLIEVRTDEPSFIRGSYCEKVSSQLLSKISSIDPQQSSDPSDLNLE